jgi:ATP-dependent exoDNAse (exonuclease V) beta subunit
MFALLKPVQIMVSSAKEWLSAFLQKLMPQQQTATPHQAPKGNLFERLLAQVFGFFKPKQKDNPEEKEREQRFLEDYNDESVWGRRFVESSSGAGSGGGQK